MNSSASGVRISANSAVTRPETCTSVERACVFATEVCIAAFYEAECGTAT